jgi:hypothetical protein
MFKLEILTHWIVPQQGKNHSEIDEEPVLLDGPWVGRVNTLKQRIASTGMNMPIAKCFSKTKNGGVEAFLDSLEAFIPPESPALR